MSQDATTPGTTRAAEHYRRLRWLTAELLLIVLGVLIALAIDEWREKRADAETEIEYLVQLTADLKSTEDLMAAVADRNAIAEAAIAELVGAFESEEIPTLRELRQMLEDIAFFNNPVPILGTAEALVSTGDLTLIGETSIRSEITTYLSRSRDYHLLPLYQFENDHRHLMLRVRVLAHRSGIAPRNQTGPVHDRTASDITGFLGSPEAYAVASELARLKNGMRSYRTSLAQESADLRESLEALLEAN